MSNKNSSSNLLRQLSGSKGRSGLSNIFSGTPVSQAGTLKPASSAGGSNSGFNAGKPANGIQFGKAPVQKTTASTGTDWTKLLEQTASSGLASAFGGSFGLGSIAGIGSIISGIASLFGGSSKQAPLQAFALPASQNQTIALGANGSTTLNSTSTASLQDQSAQIAQAVKTALLQSSSLNDVIAEI